MENTEAIDIYNTEILEEETYTDTEAVIVADADQMVQVLEEIRFDLRVILLFVILTFCSACLRAWRNNVIKGAK